MLRALRTAASGMTAQQLYIDLVAHNLANVNTNGFKKSRADFEDLLYQTLRAAGPGEGETQQPAPLQVGHGAKLVSASKVFSQGDSEVTGQALDVAIEGDGFFQIQMADGTTSYTRDGSLRIDGEGRLVSQRGMLLTPEITVPEDTVAIFVNADGQVVARTAGSEDATELGQLLLARFVNPSGLEAAGGNLLRASPSSGDAIVGAPGDLGIGTLRQGALERSNVDAVEEMISMIVAQRAFEINSKSVRTAEDMLGMISTMKR
jgi:flagellar basal-body rod protein FlgG